MTHRSVRSRALTAVAARPTEVFLPRLVRNGNRTFSVYQDDPAYDSGDLARPGPRHRMQMLKVGYHYLNDLDPPDGVPGP